MERSTRDFIETVEGWRNKSYLKEVDGGYAGTRRDWDEKIQNELEAKELEEENKRLAHENRPIIQRAIEHHKSANEFLPTNWELKTFDSMIFDSNKKLQNIAEAIWGSDKDEYGSFWLSGGVGCGKTHLLLAKLNQLSCDYYNTHKYYHNNCIKFWNYSDLCSVLRQEPNNFELVKWIRSASYLFIDDVGTSKSSDFIQEKIYSIFNYRCENELSTFVSTNLTLAEVQQEFNDRMVSRIKQSSAWIELSGVKDYRSTFISKNMARYKNILENK